MAYGLQVTGKDTAGNSFYVVDTTTTSTTYLAPVTGGIHDGSTDNRNVQTGTENSGAGTIGWSAGKLAFARPIDTEDDLQFNQNRTSRYNCHYSICEAISGLSSNVNGSSYGLKVFNAANVPIVIFDSRKTDSGVEILAAYEKAAFSGGYQVYTSVNLVWDGSSSQTATEFKNTYVTVVGSSYYYEDPVEVVINGFYFDHANRKIYYRGYNMGYGVTAIPNVAAILVGEFNE